MSGMLSQIRQKQSRLRGRIDRVLRELKNWKRRRRDGKELGINLPDELGDRIDRQCVVWGAHTKRQLVGTCIVLGLQELEELGALRQEAKEDKRRAAQPPEPRPLVGVRPEIKEFVREVQDDIPEGAMEEVQEVPGSSDQGDE
jgi:hypothetical protein